MNEKKKTGGVEKEVKKVGEETIKISFWTGLLVYLISLVGKFAPRNRSRSLAVKPSLA